MWLGVDDTDGPDSGCTTFVLTEILRAARELGVDLVGEPRLVRLNPNVPFKTRGNGALSARFGRGRGPWTTVGEIDGLPVRAFGRGAPLPERLANAFEEKAWQVVRHASARGPRVDPALVVAKRRPPAEFYYDAVRSLVPVRRARRVLEQVGGHARTRGSAQGLVGAVAAIAWPGRRATWERIAYRAPERIGTVRRIDAASVRRAQARDARLFLCYDARTRRLLVAPHTSCPILYGLRATSPRALAPAARSIESEPVDRWVLFRTNQRTGDHLVDRSPGDTTRYGAARVRGRVAAPPVTGRGGHVRFALVGEDGRSLDCVAFEPTKSLARVAAALLPDDRLMVWGGRGADAVLRVEGIRVERLAAPTVVEPPRCPPCGRRGRSLGRLRGYRCPGCGRRWPPEAGRRVRLPRALARGTYHPTPSARRHLAPAGPEELGSVVDL